MSPHPALSHVSIDADYSTRCDSKLYDSFMPYTILMLFICAYLCRLLQHFEFHAAASHHAVPSQTPSESRPSVSQFPSVCHTHMLIVSLPVVVDFCLLFDQRQLLDPEVHVSSIVHGKVVTKTQKLRNVGKRLKLQSQQKQGPLYEATRGKQGREHESKFSHLDFLAFTCQSALLLPFVRVLRSRGSTCFYGSRHS